MTCLDVFHANEQESDLDVEVEEGAGDDEYLALLSARLPSLVDQVRPDLIFYQVTHCCGLGRLDRWGDGGGWRWP